jgi:predicted molibdopterin-dependent oxidoreductase YjgC
VERLREAKFLAVMGWADSPLARAADVVLPVATHAERSGTFVNAGWRVQRFDQAFPAPPQVRAGVEALADLLSRFDPKWSTVTPATIFDLMAEELPAFSGLRFRDIAAEGTRLPQAAEPAPAGTGA